MQDRPGPVHTGTFSVEIDGETEPGWLRVELPSQTTESSQYREDNDRDSATKTIGQTSLGTLTMERQLVQGSTLLHDWALDVRGGNLEAGRREVVVTITDEQGAPQLTWTFTDCWIRHYDPPELDASADGTDRREDGAGEVATETVVLAFDSMERQNHWG